MTTTQGRFQYDVTKTQVVDPTDVAVLDATSTPTLTLTTCNPRYSAATRMVVTASLVSPVVPAAPVAKRSRKHREQAIAPSTELLASDGSLPGPSGGASPAPPSPWPSGWCTDAFRHWWVYGAGAVGLLVLLFYFFGQLSPLLPAGY